MKSFAFAALAVLAVAACDRNDSRAHDRTTTTTTTGASVGRVANDNAIDRIVSARCEREAACKNVGHDKRFETQATCVSKVRGDMRDALSPKDCPKGIDAKELDECLTAIEKEDCNNPIEMIERIAACRTSDMCLKTDLPNR